MHSFLDTRSLARRAVSWLVLAASALLAGCGGGDGERRPGLVADASAACDGANLHGVKSTVLVSTQGSDTGTCGGDPSNACKTIQRGIDNCAGSGCAVLVRYGLYPTSATIKLRDGVSVYGGCRFGGDPDRGYRTTIQASPAPATAAIAGSAIDTPTVVHGLVVIGKNEETLGTASIAMALANSKGVTLTRSMLVAGNAGDGADGTTTPAQPGGAGQPAHARDGAAGGPACPSAGPPSAGHGGQGGDGLRGYTPICFVTCYCQYPNLDSSVGRQGNPSGAVAGGDGGTRSWGGNYCTSPVFGDDYSGKSGQPGSAGACSGSGGAASDDLWGTISLAGWAPGAGGSGGVGDVGSGGGGGSSGGLCVGFPDGIHSEFVDGVPAGGGGGGGCGGNGGNGGGQGGASIALLLGDSSIAFDAAQVAIVSASGGDGGVGGSGGVGGAGGNGGDGRTAQTVTVGSSKCPGPSGRGGNGGQGGAGAGGAGGNGGPSIGIALRGSSTAPSLGDAVYLGAPGRPGANGGGGANPNCTGAAGGSGFGGGAAQIVNLDRPPNDILASGQSLGHTATRSESRISANGKYALVMQTDGNLCLGAWPTFAYIWCSAQNGMGFNDSVTMGYDGSFCLFGDRGGCIDTSHPGAYLKVTDDGRALFHSGSEVVWSLP